MDVYIAVPLRLNVVFPSLPEYSAKVGQLTGVHFSIWMSHLEWTVPVNLNVNLQLTLWHIIPLKNFVVLLHSLDILATVCEVYVKWMNEWMNEWKPFIASIHGKSHKTKHNHNRQKVVPGSNAFVLRIPNIKQNFKEMLQQKHNHKQMTHNNKTRKITRM